MSRKERKKNIVSDVKSKKCAKDKVLILTDLSDKQTKKQKTFKFNENH